MKNLVLISGWASNSTIWDALLLELSSNYNIIKIDLPGYGDSPAINNYDLTTVSSTILEQVPEPAIWIGWSLGGMIIQHIAYTNPQLISQMILLSSTAKFNVREKVISNIIKGVKEDKDKTIANFFILQTRGEHKCKTTQNRLQSSWQKKPLPSTKTLIDSLTLLHSLDLSQQIKEINTQTVWLHGSEDKVILPQDSQSSSALMPNSQHLIIQGIGHATPVSTELTSLTGLNSVLTKLS